MKIDKRVLLILITVALVFSPFDPSVILNRIIGFKVHVWLWAGLIVLIILLIPGKGYKAKFKNAKGELKSLLN